MDVFKEWNNFEFSYENFTFTVYWNSKTFFARYESETGLLEYDLHIMYMCPKKYSEESIKGGYGYSLGRAFKYTENFLKNNPDFIESAVLQFYELKKSKSMSEISYSYDKAVSVFGEKSCATQVLKNLLLKNIESFKKLNSIKAKTV